MRGFAAAKRPVPARAAAPAAGGGGGRCMAWRRGVGGMAEE
jgi:hypothetical protein